MYNCKTYKVLSVWCYRDPFLSETLLFNVFTYGIRKKLKAKKNINKYSNISSNTHDKRREVMRADYKQRVI